MLDSVTATRGCPDITQGRPGSAPSAHCIITPAVLSSPQPCCDVTSRHYQVPAFSGRPMRKTSGGPGRRGLAGPEECFGLRDGQVGGRREANQGQQGAICWARQALKRTMVPGTRYNIKRCQPWLRAVLEFSRHSVQTSDDRRVHNTFTSNIIKIKNKTF